MMTSRLSTSSVEQGELEASPQIILEPDESSEPESVHGGRVEKKSRMNAVDISSPDRYVGFTLGKVW